MKNRLDHKRVTALVLFALSSSLLIFCGLPPREKAADILSKGLSDESAIIRVNAAKGYAALGDRRGPEYLSKALADEDKETVVAALNALYETGESQLLPVIIQLTQSDNPMLRTEAFRLVAIIHDTVSRNILVKGTKDKIAKIRRIAFRNLESYGFRELIRTGLRDVDALTRIAAATALGKLGEPGMENFVRRELDPKKFSAEVWSQGTIALAEIGDTASIAFIRELLVDTPWDLKVAAAEALLILKDRTGIETIEGALKSNDPFVRVKAVEIVQRFPLGELYETVKETTADQYINVSIGAINALIAYHKKESFPVYEKLLNAPNPLLKIAAATAYLSDK
ncbi:MAG TPA: HEAT repeat domain-containing protein [bacterium]